MNAIHTQGGDGEEKEETQPMQRQTILTLLLIVLAVGMLVAVADPVVAEHQVDQEFTVTVIGASPLSTAAPGTDIR